MGSTNRAKECIFAGFAFLLVRASVQGSRTPISARRDHSWTSSRISYYFRPNAGRVSSLRWGKGSDTRFDLLRYLDDSTLRREVCRKKNKEPQGVRRVHSCPELEGGRVRSVRAARPNHLIPCLGWNRSPGVLHTVRYSRGRQAHSITLLGLLFICICDFLLRLRSFDVQNLPHGQTPSSFEAVH